jgi:HEAT repeat protein
LNQSWWGTGVNALDPPYIEEPDMPKHDSQAVDNAFTALATFDWGSGLTLSKKDPPKDAHLLAPIDEAVFATRGDAAGRSALEARLAAVLTTGASRAAKDYICRKLMVIGTAASVPALAGLLADKENSHMARYALERISAPEAAAALRDALPTLSGALKVGAIGSLGARRDAGSVQALAAALRDADKAVACAAATALGDIGGQEAAVALADSAPTASDEVKLSVADARLACAERSLADGRKADAAAIYKSLVGPGEPKHVRLAATHGMLLVAGKKD